MNGFRSNVDYGQNIGFNRIANHQKFMGLNVEV